MILINLVTPGRKAALTGLAVVGFITLVILGILFAVYSARYVPTAARGIGAAAVYLGSVFTPAPAPTLVVIPSASTTIAFPEATTTALATPTAPAKPSQPVTPTPGQTTSGTYQIGGNTPSAPYGFPDLTVSINAVGYLATTSAESFVAALTVPNGSRPAVKFTVKNSGTNIASAWRFSASIPTQITYVYQSQLQQPLNPGDSIEFTLGFDQANRGTDQTISVTVNPDNAVTESATNNNSASAKLTILGS